MSIKSICRSVSVTKWQLSLQSLYQYPTSVAHLFWHNPKQSRFISRHDLTPQVQTVQVFIHCFNASIARVSSLSGRSRKHFITCFVGNQVAHRPTAYCTFESQQLLATNRSTSKLDLSRRAHWRCGRGAQQSGSAVGYSPFTRIILVNFFLIFNSKTFNCSSRKQTTSLSIF